MHSTCELGKKWDATTYFRGDAGLLTEANDLDAHVEEEWMFQSWNKDWLLQDHHACKNTNYVVSKDDLSYIQVSF